MITDKDITDIQDRLQALEDSFQFLQQKRITQVDLVPGSVKQRHINEGVVFIRSGLAANKPTSGEPTATGKALYWATDTHTLYIWDGTVWRSQVFT